MKNTVPSAVAPIAAFVPAIGKTEDIAGITTELATNDVMKRRAYFSRRIAMLMTANAPITPATSSAVPPI